MNKLLLASMRKGAGKTSIIVGIGAATKKNFGYIKPFGDRLIYRRKKNWDYDAGLIKNLWQLEGESTDITIGFNHSKLRYVYNQENLPDTIQKMADIAGINKSALFIEGGQDLSYGASLHLDSISQAMYTGSKFIVVIGGDHDSILDDIDYLKKYLALSNINFAGIIINKVQDVMDFKNIYSSRIQDLNINILGVIPFEKSLSYFSVQYISDRLFAKVIAGEGGLNQYIKNIFVGAMSTGNALRNPLFKKEQKLLITSGDRSDMILAALESDTAGIILTNNILPPPNILAKASESNIPLMLVRQDTFQVARQIDRTEPLLTFDSTDKITLLASLIKKHVKINELLS